jgi:multidrug efflux pump subunit AcrA (membrane-fusion protein)
MVPDEAIQSDQARKTVLVVGKDGTVAAKPVELGRSCAVCALSAAVCAH